MVNIVCFGDSNTWGVDPATQERLGPMVRWPGALRATLDPGYEIIEEGLRGRTTVWDDPFEEGRNGLAYFVPCLKSHAPLDLVTLMLGTNDLKAVFRLRPGEIAAGIAALVRAAQRSAMGPGGGAPSVLVIAPPPIRGGGGRTDVWRLGGQAAEISRAIGPLLKAVADGGGLRVHRRRGLRPGIARRRCPYRCSGARSPRVRGGGQGTGSLRVTGEPCTP